MRYQVRASESCALSARGLRSESCRLRCSKSDQMSHAFVKKGLNGSRCTRNREPVGGSTGRRAIERGRVICQILCSITPSPPLILLSRLCQVGGATAAGMRCPSTRYPLVGLVRLCSTEHSWHLTLAILQCRVNFRPTSQKDRLRCEIAQNMVPDCKEHTPTALYMSMHSQTV